MSLTKTDATALAAAARRGMLQDLSGMTFVLTGTMSMTRGDMVLLIESLGGKVAPAVSSRTTMLIQADGAASSSKLRAARMMSVNVRSESQFARMLAAGIL